MKIDLVKIKFNNSESYKYKPVTYCCEKLKRSKSFVLANCDFENEEDYEMRRYTKRRYKDANNII